MVVKFCAWVVLGVAASSVACSTSSPATTHEAGGPVPGDPDTHCRPNGQLQAKPIDLNACHGGLKQQHEEPESEGPDAGESDAGDADYGATLYNAEGDDDDCKYHVKYTSTPLRQGDDVTFSVAASILSTVNSSEWPDGDWLTGAEPYVEAFLTPTHPAPNSGATTSQEVAGKPGNYTIGPIRFDAPGKWTVRFHFFGSCEDDGPTSPHSHVAFYVNIP